MATAPFPNCKSLKPYCVICVVLKASLEQSLEWINKIKLHIWSDNVANESVVIQEVQNKIFVIWIVFSDNSGLVKNIIRIILTST